MITMTKSRTRLVLRVNAVSSLMCGLIGVFGSVFVQADLIPMASIWLIAATGVACAVFGAWVLWISNRPRISIAALREIFFLDIAWVIGSVIVALWMPQAFSALGMLIWLAIALVVADYAILEYLALKAKKASSNVNAPARQL